MESDVEVDAAVYDRVIEAAAPPQWLRLMMLVQRMRAGSGFLLSSMTHAAVWDSASGCARSQPVKPKVQPLHEVMTYFENQFEFPEWVEVVLVCDVEETHRTTVRSAPAGPPETSYTTGFDHPFWQYVDEHQAELDDLGRRRFRTAKRGFLRRS